MYSSKGYRLEKEEYNYLLPVLRTKMLTSGDKYYFIDLTDGLRDMLDRLKGLYNNYDELNNMTCYKCFREGSLVPFRNEIGIGIS